MAYWSNYINNLKLLEAYGNLLVLVEREIEETRCVKEVDEIATLLHQLTLLSSDIEESDAMEAHEYLNYELEFDFKNPYEFTDEEFLDMLPSDQQELDVDEVVVDEVEEVIELGVAQRALETLKKYFQQRPNNVLSHIRTIQVLQKEVSSHRLEDSHQTTIDSFFQIVWLKESCQSTII